MGPAWRVRAGAVGLIGVASPPGHPAHWGAQGEGQGTDRSRLTSASFRLHLKSLFDLLLQNLKIYY